MSIKENLKAMSSVELSSVRVDEITNISNIKIDNKADDITKLISYLKQNSNPYFLNVNGAVVKISFTNTGLQLSELLEDFFVNFNNS